MKEYSKRVYSKIRKRDTKIAEAVEKKYGYRKSEIARYFGLHASTVSSLVRNRG